MCNTVSITSLPCLDSSRKGSSTSVTHMGRDATTAGVEEGELRHPDDYAVRHGDTEHS